MCGFDGCDTHSIRRQMYESQPSIDLSQIKAICLDILQDEMIIKEWHKNITHDVLRHLDSKKDDSQLDCFGEALV